MYLVPKMKEQAPRGHCQWVTGLRPGRAYLPPRRGLGQAHLLPLGSGTQAGGHLAGALCPPGFTAQAPSSRSVPACRVAGGREALTGGPVKGLWTPAWQKGQPSSLEWVYA